MSKRLYLYSIPFILVVVFFIFLFKQFFLGPRVCFAGSCLYVELAKTRQERTRGLMFRRGLPRQKGMLFIFPAEDLWSFWTKNTYVRLDIIWLDKNRKVVDMAANTTVGSDADFAVFSPRARARYVLEAPAGFAAAAKIKFADEAKFMYLN